MKNQTRPLSPFTNPYLYITFAEAAKVFGLGRDTIGQCVALGAPTVARKINCGHFHAWLSANAEKIGKIRPEKGDDEDAE